MMSPKDTSPEEKGADADGAERDGAKREKGVAESDCCDRNWASLRLTVAESMAHMMVKWSEEGKGTEKWHKILTTSLKISTLPLTKMSYTNSPPKYDYSHIPKLFPLFVTSDKG